MTTRETKQGPLAKLELTPIRDGERRERDKEERLMQSGTGIFTR
jgi:hypothetical protein